MTKILRRLAFTTAALTGLAAVSAAQLPKVQLALVLDGAVVHRVDVRTGKYLGNFGQGTFFGASTLAVQPSTKIVFVEDTHGIRKFDMSTGRSLGLFNRTPFSTGTSFTSALKVMRFAPSGDLYGALQTSLN